MLISSTFLIVHFIFSVEEIFDVKRIEVSQAAAIDQHNIYIYISLKCRTNQGRTRWSHRMQKELLLTKGSVNIIYSGI